MDGHRGIRPAGKSDLAFVIHYQTPGSVIAYYQQVGRAGRALAAAYGVLLSGSEDTDITDFFIETDCVLCPCSFVPAGMRARVTRRF